MLSNRLVAEVEGSRRASTRLLAVDVREGVAAGDPGSAVYQTVGFTSPLLLVGPIERQGLHRIVARPLGVRATSSALSEATRLRLDGSFARPPREAVSLRLWEDRLQLSGLRTRTGRASATAYLAPLRTQTVSAELFLVRSGADPVGIASDPDVVEESWTIEEWPQGGGERTLTAARIAVTRSRTEIRGIAGASTIQSLPPGGFLLFAHQTTGRGYELQTLAGLQSAYYMEESGEHAGDRTRLGARLLLPWHPLTLEGSLHHRSGYHTVDGSSLDPTEVAAEAEVLFLLADRVVGARRPGHLEVETFLWWAENRERDRDLTGATVRQTDREVGAGIDLVVGHGLAELSAAAEHERRIAGDNERRWRSDLGVSIDLDATGRVRRDVSIDTVFEIEQGPSAGETSAEVAGSYRWSIGKAALSVERTREVTTRAAPPVLFVELSVVLHRSVPGPSSD